MQISTQTDNQNLGENVATNENCILRKMGLKRENSGFNILCKIAFWNKQNWLNSELNASPGGAVRQRDRMLFQACTYLGISQKKT